MTWRVGTKLGRTLYRDEVLVGMVDTPELAKEIVEAMNSVTELREEVARLEHNAIDDEAQLMKANRELDELQEAVAWAALEPGVAMTSSGWSCRGLSFENYGSNPVEALKRLHARNKTT